jgi:small-conductance mechanosensitive channel
MTRWLEWLQNRVYISPEMGWQIFESLIVLIAIWLLRQMVLRIAYRRSEELKARYNWRRSSAYLASFIAVLLIAPLWLTRTDQIITYLGLLSAGLAIALKDPLSNLVGWGYILWRRPFSMGDRIQIGTHAGDVIDINVFKFVMMEIGNWVDADQSTGRILHIPNSQVFLEPIANYTEEFNFIWDEIPITLTFESDWQAAKTLLGELAAQLSAPEDEVAAEMKKQQRHKYYYYYTYLTPTVYTSLKDNGVCLTIRYLCQTRQRRIVEQAFIEEVLSAFALRDDIQLAYSTLRNIVELSGQNPN